MRRISQTRSFVSLHTVFFNKVKKVYALYVNSVAVQRISTANPKIYKFFFYRRRVLFRWLIQK